MQTNDKLRVHRIDDADINRDVVRIHRLQRSNDVGEGRVCKLSVLDEAGSPRRSIIVAIRGIPDYYLVQFRDPLPPDPDVRQKTIIMDEITRTRLGVQLGEA